MTDEQFTAAADWLRRRWLRLLGPLARPIVTRRELRVALGFSLVIGSALVATLVAPLWMLILGPLVWGVPHLVADLRYLVVRPGYHRRPLLALFAGAPLLWVGLGGGLCVIPAFGFHRNTLAGKLLADFDLLQKRHDVADGALVFGDIQKDAGNFRLLAQVLRVNWNEAQKLECVA